MTNKAKIEITSRTIVWLAFAVSYFHPGRALIMLLFHEIPELEPRFEYIRWVAAGTSLLIGLVPIMICVIGYLSRKLWGRIVSGGLFLFWLIFSCIGIYRVITNMISGGSHSMGDPILWGFLSLLNHVVFAAVLASALVVLVQPNIWRVNK